MSKTYVQAALLAELMRRDHLNNSLLARKLEMDRSTVFRALQGRPVGEKFVNHLMTVYPEKGYFELFFQRITVVN